MHILLLGSGGREHAFAWKIVNSLKCTKLYVAPGNAGTGSIAQNVSIGINDFEGIAEFVKANHIELVVIGPEEPLVKGVTDYLAKHPRTKGVPVIGPGLEGSKLEGSKDYSKEFMKRHGIPTAASETFTKSNIEQGIAFIKKQKLPVVLKADGLAAGKGVLICQSYDEAEANLKEMLLQSKFGEASEKVVIEQFLEGIELSVFVATDGKSYKLLPEAKDYKRIGENDMGLNTGGMGAISPVPFASKEFLQKVEDKIVKPTIEGLKKDSIKYTGFLFIGLMNDNGEPFVIEYNVRMGDPETQAVLARMEGDFVEFLLAMANQKLDQYALQVSDKTATTVVMVAGGYPEAYEKGNTIEGIDKIQNSEHCLLFHAGTKINHEGKTVTNGGRVLSITGLGSTIQEALYYTYDSTSQICWDKIYYRRDIGQDVLTYKQ